MPCRNRVKGTVGGVTTVYIAGIYEHQAGATTKYYEGGGLRRTGYSTNNGVFYMLSDHLKSTSTLVARNGVLNVKYFYYPYGARRGVPFNTITAKHFTGQYHETSLPGGEGISFYNARWYDPKLGRFLSADTIVPNASNPQDLNRYAYVRNNPLKFIDPTGHMVACSAAGEGCGGGGSSGGSGGGSGSGGSTGNTWTPSPPVYGPAPRPASGGSSGSGGLGIGGTSQLWWQGVWPPSIRTVQPGGRYGHGEILYGDRLVPLYLPPQVRVVSTVSEYYPLYRAFREPAILAPSYIMDDWYGEPCSSGLCTVPGGWTTVDMRMELQTPTGKEIVIGIAIGLNQSPESLPPGPETTRAENKADLAVTGLYGMLGALQQGRHNMFVLQRDARDNFRLIVLTRQFDDYQPNYVTFSGQHPVGVMPICIEEW